MHIFKFSPRKNTRAAVMDGQLSEDIKNKRSDVLLDLALEGAGRYMKSHIGRTEEVLLEEEKTILGKRYMIGHTPDYIPVADDPCQNRRYTAGPGYSHEIFFFMIYHPLGHGFPPEKTGGYLSIPLPFVTVCDQTTVLDLFLSSISFCFCSLLSFLDILP